MRSNNISVTYRGGLGELFMFTSSTCVLSTQPLARGLDYQKQLAVVDRVELAAIY